MWGQQTRKTFQVLLTKLVAVIGGVPSVVNNHWKARLTLTMMMAGMQDCLFKVNLAHRQYGGKYGPGSTESDELEQSLETSEDVPVVPDLLLDNTADLGILRRFGVPSTSDD